MTHLGRRIREVLNAPDAEGQPAEMKELLAKLDDMLADKGMATSDSDLKKLGRMTGTGKKFQCSGFDLFHIATPIGSKP